ncbi:hypothetical protein ACFL35_13910, partial [Candidatus Riflebacteria bacterium]
MKFLSGFILVLFFLFVQADLSAYPFPGSRDIILFIDGKKVISRVRELLISGNSKLKELAKELKEFQHLLGNEDSNPLVKAQKKYEYFFTNFGSRINKIYIFLEIDSNPKKDRPIFLIEGSFSEKKLSNFLSFNNKTPFQYKEHKIFPEVIQFPDGAIKENNHPLALAFRADSIIIGKPGDIVNFITEQEISSYSSERALFFPFFKNLEKVRPYFAMELHAPPGHFLQNWMG